MKKLIYLSLMALCTFMGASSVFADELTGTKWNWVSTKTPTDSTTASKPTDYTLDFKPGGKVVVKADCNTGNGTYSTTGNRITFGAMAMTRMACPPGSMDTKFLQGLSAARTYNIITYRMTFDLEAGAGTMLFRREGSNPLPGSTWSWSNSKTPAGTITPPISSNYTLQFLVGTVTVKADCNTGTTTYVVTGNKIKFGPMAMTRMACPPGSLDSTFLKHLGSVKTFSVADDSMTMDMGSKGTMNYASVGATAANPLVGTKWNWINTMSAGKMITVPEPKNYTLAFLTDTRSAVQADCNKGNGSYAVDGNKIKFGPMAMTMMACPPGSLDSTFNRQLGAASTYRFTGDLLIIELSDGGTMRFNQNASPEFANPLVGTAWNWVSTQTPNEKTTVPEPKNYGLAFVTGTQVSVQADCNKGNGSYTVDGNKIKFGPMAMTMMACPPGSLDLTFKRQLGAASTYKIIGDRLMIDLIADGGTMTFVRRAK